MLVLSRKQGERIILRDKVTKSHIGEVIVVDIDRNKIRLGLAFNSDVEIYRSEILPESAGSHAVNSN